MKKNKEQKVLGGTRRVIKLGNSLAITLPSQFTHESNIKEGDDIPYALNPNMMKLIPMPED